MNIEEERLAFLQVMKTKLIAEFGCGSLEHGYDDSSFNNENVQDFFECWLAAKENAKPLAVIKEVNYATRCTLAIPWWTVEGVCCKCEHQTREACEQWAVANGYRLE